MRFLNILLFWNVNFKVFPLGSYDKNGLLDIFTLNVTALT